MKRQEKEGIDVDNKSRAMPELSTIMLPPYDDPPALIAMREN